MEFSELRFIRIYDFNLIPRYLFDQVKGSAVDVDRLMLFGPNLAKDALTLLYALADAQNRIQGFVWAGIDVLEGHIHVNAMSVDKDYQGGDALLGTAIFLRKQTEGSQLSQKITFATTRPKAFEKLGFQRTKLVNMEIEP